MTNLTYEQCREIVLKNENFYEKVDIVNGVKVSTFNYILSIYDQFKKPFNNAQVEAFELRGISFIHLATGPKRCLMLHKFFNLNENEDYLVANLKNNKIIQIQEKLDGSMIRFISVDNSIVAKTKVGFTNPQTKLANDILEKNKDLYNFVKETLDQGLVAIFEICSPFNKIVVSYNQTELKLLQIREENSGLYLDIYNHPLVLKYNVQTTPKHDLLSFEQLLEKQQTEENKEGYVVTLDNGVKFKLKTKWYIERHRLMDKTSYEDNLVKMIIEEQIDDAISLLDKDNERRVYAEKIQLFLVKHVSKIVHDCVILKSKYNGNRKEFALSYKNDKSFHFVVGLLDSQEFEEKVSKKVKEFIIFNCRRLEMARKYLKDNGFVLSEMVPLEE